MKCIELTKQYEKINWPEEIDWPEGFEERLKGKSLAEQMSCYAISEDSALTSQSYGETDWEKYSKHLIPLNKYNGIYKLLVKNEMMIGLIIKTNLYGLYALFPYQSVCTYYSSDNDGCGSRSREDTATLVCVPENEVKKETECPFPVIKFEDMMNGTYRKDVPFPENLPEGFLDLLRGKSIEEQMEYYAVATRPSSDDMYRSKEYTPENFYETDWNKEFAYGRLIPLNKYYKYADLYNGVTIDGILVGLEIKHGRTKVTSSCSPQKRNVEYYGFEKLWLYPYKLIEYNVYTEIKDPITTHKKYDRLVCVLPPEK